MKGVNVVLKDATYWYLKAVMVMQSRLILVILKLKNVEETWSQFVETLVYNADISNVRPEQAEETTKLGDLDTNDHSNDERIDESVESFVDSYSKMDDE